MLRPGSTVTLRPAQAFDVHVVHADDGTPAVGARVTVQSIDASRPKDDIAQGPDRRPGPRAGRRLAGRRVPGPASIRPRASRTSTPGATSTGPRRPSSKSVELKLGRGVVVRGRLIEDPAGTPVAGAWVVYHQTIRNNPRYANLLAIEAVSGPDGTFTMVVPRGPGARARPGTQRRLPARRDQLHRYGDRPAPQLPPVSRRPRRPGHQGRRGDAPARAAAAAGRDRRRAASSRPTASRSPRLPCSGGATRPTGEHGFPLVGFNGDPPQIEVKDGRFEIPGCDPDKPSTFYFLDLKDQLGATVELSGKSAAAGPVTVRLRAHGDGPHPHEGRRRQAARQSRARRLALRPEAGHHPRARIRGSSRITSTSLKVISPTRSTSTPSATAACAAGPTAA